jgi:UDP-glucose 4-epimerase
MVVPRLLGQALEGRNLTVYGDGGQSRCFTYVSDVIEWLLMIGETDAAVGEVFNLGNPEEVTIRELAERIIRLTGSGSRIEYIPYEKAYEEGFEDMRRRVPDITKIVKLTSYSPRVPLDDTLRLTCEWLLSRREDAPAKSMANAI